MVETTLIPLTLNPYPQSTNPTRTPATSPLLNGVWNLKVVGSYGSSKITSPTREIALFLYSGGYSPAVFLLKLLR